MACGCGGNGGSGGCGGDKPRTTPEKTELGHALPPLKPTTESPTKTPDISAPGTLLSITEPPSVSKSASVPEQETPSEAAERINCNEEEWPQTAVNGTAIKPESIAQEMQYHPASDRGEAVYQAVQALVIRELLLQRTRELGLKVKAHAGESEEEALTRQLLDQEVQVDEPDEAACEHFYASNLSRFVSAPLLAARHILLGCAPDDGEGRSLAQEKAKALLAELTQDPERFAALALAHSDCPSKAQGGALGQISKGQTVPEFERQLFRQTQGLVGQPLESRYGFHVVSIDQRIDGTQLPYIAVAANIRRELYQRVWQKSVAQYLQDLVSAADIKGVELAGAAQMSHAPSLQ
jgi:peptidyl-prolyl cis-trans isomerase C